MTHRHPQRPAAFPIAMLIFIMGLLSPPVIHAVTGEEQIAPNQPEYTLGDTAVIYGTGFAPGSSVIVEVIRADGSIVTGNGTDTPGSDTVTTSDSGAFTYFYLVDGASPAAFSGTLTVNAKEAGTLAVLASTSFKDGSQFMLQGCSKDRGDCTLDNPATGWAGGSSPMTGWTSGNLKGWFEGDNVPYRLRIGLRDEGSAGTLYFTTEHDNMKDGIPGITSASDFYVGYGPAGSMEGTLTKNCRLQPSGSAVPTLSDPCIVTGPTYTGTGIGSSVKKIQYAWAVLFDASEDGDSEKKWAVYWTGHLAAGSHNWPGSSLHSNTTATGDQDVPISDIEESTPSGANLSISKSDTPDPVLVGQNLTYTVVVANTGPSTATGVTVTDTLPTVVTYGSATASQGTCSMTGGRVTCSLGTLANGASATVTIVVTPLTVGTLSNTAIVSSSVADPDPSNNTSPPATTTVNPSANLSLFMTDSPDPVPLGQNLTYTITVTNSGPNSATVVTVTDRLPGGVIFVSATSSQGSCSHASGTVTCSLTESLGRWVSAMVTIVVTPTVAGTLTDTAIVSSGVTDPNPANNISTATTTVLALPTLSIGNASAAEGGAGTSNLNFTVTLSAARTSPVTVNYATTDGTATAPSDYVATSGTLTIPAGGTSGTISVPVNGDALYENPETFTVTLSSPTNATIATATGTGTITNDDAAPTLAINDVSQAEGNAGTTSVVFTVTQSTASGLATTVTYATADGTATAGTDYTATSGTLTIPAGGTSGTISVAVTGDTTVEPDETFVVNLTAPTNATILDGLGLGTILYDDGVAIQTELLSLPLTGTGGNGLSLRPVVSSDGRYVAFQSDAGNLVSGDTNAQRDVFVRDRTTGATRRVSVASDGTQGNGASSFAAMSGDGRYVAVYSAASNLVAGDTNGVADTFVRDLQTETTTRVSASSAGAQANGESLRPTAISADGRYAAFTSRATNLVPGDTNVAVDVFVRDLGANTTVRVSVATGGLQANAGNFQPSLSADGRYVAFVSRASNLVAGDTNGTGDIYRHDRDPDGNGIFDEGNGVTIRVSVPSLSEVGLPSNKPSISMDGRYVAYASQSATLVPGDTNGVFDVFVADLAAGTTVRASVDGAGAQGNGASDFPAISGDGRIVAFQSDAANLVTGDTNATSDTFVRDLGMGATIRVSVETSGAEGNGASRLPAVSSTGHIVALSSLASNLAPGDTNGVEDVFIRQW